MFADRRHRVFQAKRAPRSGNIDTGEHKGAVAGKQTPVDLLERINTNTNEAKWCLDRRGLLGWLSWLAWLSWLFWQATLEASEGPSSEIRTRMHLCNHNNVCLGSCAGMIYMMNLLSLCPSLYWLEQ